MQNLSFDDGFKEFSINNDPNRVIRFNPADIGIIERIKIAYEEIDKAILRKEDIELKADGTPIEQLGQAAEIVEGVANTIKKQIDFIFNSDMSDIAFGKQSPLSMVSGKPLFMRFLDAVIPIVEKEVKAGVEASRKRVSKYTKQVR